MLKTLFNITALVISLALLYSVYKSVKVPATFELSVRRQMTSKPEKIFALLTVPARFPEWEPWSKADPSVRISLDGPSSGIGSVFQWSSKRRGNVLLQWRAAEAPLIVSYVVTVHDYGGRYDMDFLIEQDPIDEHVVTLTWVLRGKRKPLEKPFWYFFKLEEVIRRDFEAGLNNINALLEAK